MKQDWLDNSLGDKLDGYDSPMDLENAWEALQAKRQAPEKKKKNRFFFIWILFGLVTIGLGGSYFLLNNATDNPITKTSTEVKNAKIVLEKTNPASSTLLQTEKTNSNNTTDNTFTNKEEQSLTTNKNYENLGLATKNKSYENQNTSNQKETSPIVASNIHFPKKGNNDLTPSIRKVDFTETDVLNLVLPFQNEEENKEVLDQTDARNEVEPITISLLPSLEVNYLASPQLIKMERLNASISAFDDKEIINPKSASSSPIHLGIVAGYGIRSKGKVLSTENPLDVISTNLFLEKRLFTDRLYLKTGINFDQFVNRIETTTEVDLTETLDNQLITVNHFQNGTTQEIFGTAKVQTIKKTSTKNFNRYRLISVPLILGFDMISSKRASIQLEGGVARSIFGFHSGTDFDLIESDFEKQGVWQGLYGLNLNYNLGRNLNIFSSVKGNYHLNTIGKSDQLKMEKFRFYQIQLGLRFKL